MLDRLKVNFQLSFLNRLISALETSPPIKAIDLEHVSESTTDAIEIGFSEALFLF